MVRYDEFSDRRLFLIPFILNILKMTFPYANELFTCYFIAIKKLKPTKFRVERICEDHFDNLLQQNKFKQDFLGDKKSWALLSINSLVALSTFSSSWLQLFLLDDNSDSELKKPKLENQIKKIKIPKPGEVDERSIEETGDKINDFIVQCVATSFGLKDFNLFVTDEVFYNMKQKLNISTLCDSSFEVMVNVVDEEYRPEPAETAVVAAVNGSFDIIANDLQDILHEYFAKPKYLRKNDCFSVILKKYAPHLVYSSTYRHVPKIDFKVISLVGKDDTRGKFSNVGYYVAKKFTNLYLDPPVPGYLIPTVGNYVKISDKIGYEIPICPYGLKKQFDQLQSLISPFLLFGDLQAKPVYLLSGAQGSGKNTVVSCISKFFGFNVLDVDCFDFYGAGSSVTEAKFEVVASKAKKLAPCLLLLNNVELIGRDRDHNEDVRLVGAFQHHLNEILGKKSEYPVFVVGTTDPKTSELLPSVARSFLQTISFDVPKSEDAYGILKWFVAESGNACSEKVLRKASEKCNGYVFADLALLVRHANRFQRRDKTLSDRRLLLQSHFDKGLEIMESAYSDSIGAAKVPTVRWEDVGGLENLKEEIMVTLNLPLKHPQLFASGLKRSGILFYGPPGTGKTLMAKAVATECNFNFLSVKGPELMNMYVGQSEKNVREVFQRARDASPCIVFFDELDSLAPNRGKSGDSGGVTDRVVSQLLAEMDGLQENNRIFVIAATNRPDLVDPALLRPGRFDKMFYVGVCGDQISKLSVFKALTRKFNLSDDVRFEDLVEKIPGQITGADVYSVCSNAWLAAARRNIKNFEQGFEVSIPVRVTAEDFELAASEFVPSLTAEDISYYQRLKSLER